MKVTFKNSRGQELPVADVANEKEAWCEVMRYIHKINPNFKVPYVRSWGTNPIIYDVGSHTEFFHIYP